jgi:hypothetical protein
MLLEWKIMTMDCYPAKSGVSNVVYNLGWKATIVDGSHTIVTTGSTDIPVEITSEFVDYNNLTETLVLDWLFSAMGSDKTQVEDSLKESMKELKTPSTIRLRLPWA